MSRTIAVANQKGGVGKTTTTVNLAAALGSMQQRVLLIDLDPQGNATMGCGIDKYGLEHTVFDVLVDGTDCAAVTLRSDENLCDVLPSNADLTAAEIELMNLEGRERRLADALQPLQSKYDFILVDCPPSLNVLTLNAFVAADSVLVPVQCEYYALEGLSALLETIDGVRASVNENLSIEGLVRTMYDGRNNLGVEVSAQLVAHFEGQVFRTIVPRNIRLAEAPSHGLSIVHYDPASRGALAYLALGREILLLQAARDADAGASATPATEPVVDSAAGIAADESPKDESMAADPNGTDALPEPRPATESVNG